MGRRQHVCQPYGVEQHDAGRARRHDARRMGAASGNVVPCTGRRIGISWWRAAPYGATSTRRPTIRCGATRCRPHNVEQHDAKRRGAASGHVMPGGTAQDSASGTLYRRRLACRRPSRGARQHWKGRRAARQQAALYGAPRTRRHTARRRLARRRPSRGAGQHWMGRRVGAKLHGAACCMGHRGHGGPPQGDGWHAGRRRSPAAVSGRRPTAARMHAVAWSGDTEAVPPAAAKRWMHQ